jgi:hypothetical protein
MLTYLVVVGAATTAEVVTGTIAATAAETAVEGSRDENVD